MPMAKGTKPNVVNWKEIPSYVLRIAVNKYMSQFKKLLVPTTIGNTTKWVDPTRPSEVLFRRHVHKRSEQCLVAASLVSMLPTNENDDKETSSESAASSSSAARARN